MSTLLVAKLEKMGIEVKNGRIKKSALDKALTITSSFKSSVTVNDISDVLYDHLEHRQMLRNLTPKASKKWAEDALREVKSLVVEITKHLEEKLKKEPTRAKFYEKAMRSLLFDKNKLSDAKIIEE